MSKKTTRKALFGSVLALVLCVALLIGSTFAWFTDSVKSGNNVIQSGNLDIVAEYWNGTEWKDIKDATDVLTNTLWEPGATEVAYLRLKNAGSLALKYNLGIKIVSETSGTNVAGETFELSDYIHMGVVENAQPTYTTREDAVTAAKGGANGIIGDGYTKIGSMTAGQADLYLAVVVYMPETVGNEANHKTDTAAPTINLGINLVATQLEAESDSFGNDYDASAYVSDINWYLENPDATEFTIDTTAELFGLAEIVNGTAISPVTTFAADSTATIHDDFAGQTIKLGSNIDLAGNNWTPIGRIGLKSTDFTYAFKGTFDGQDYTISNLDVSNDGWAGLFGIAHNAKINNVKVDGVTIKSSRMAGSIVGQLYGNIDNCHVKNAYILVVPNAVGDSYDNGDKVGGIVGWIGDNGNNRTLTSCSATNVTLIAYRDVGGIAGYVASSTTVDKNSVEDVVITVDQTTNYYGDKDFNAGAIYGRTGGTIVEGKNESNNFSIDITYSQNGITMKRDGVTGTVMLYRVPADYSAATVEVPEGVTTIGGYAFAYNSNIETIRLSSSVKTLNDRAFRDTSASTVVLNEGLENISYQAFRNASNVTKVEIPSTVTTISKEAFQNSGITTLTIPANVTTLEYGVCRDMINLETVVIEGNVNIPVYAFRACTNLKTVIITGDNVTFGAGSRGMIFTNKENGDGSAITVYVVNETVKERLLAADTAAKDYGGYKIVITSPVDNDTSLSDVLTDGDDTVYVPSGTYTFPASDVSAGDVIICSEGTVFEGKSSLNINGATVVGATFDAGDGDTSVSGTINGTFKNCTFTGGSEGVRWCYTTAGETVVFENCIFEATVRGIHFDGMYGDVKFINCEINGFNAYGGTGTAYFEGCTFGYDESNYNGLNIYANTVLTGCTFNYVSGKTNFIDMEGTGKTLTITNCTAILDGAPANVIDFVGGSKLSQNTLTVDGLTLTKVSDGLFTDDAGSYYVYNAAGLQSLKTWMDSKSNNAFWGKTYNIMADIDASDVTWTTKMMVPDSNTFNGITFNGNGHTISNLNIAGQGLFTGTTMGSNSTVPATFNNITFANATVTGGTHHNGVVWGEAYGSITLNNVSVINSKVSGGCNVGGLIGRNSESHATFTFKDCAVKNTTVEATQAADYAGASAFLGMALHIGDSCSANVIFEGTNVAEGNTLTTAEGMKGGGIYTYATWGEATWETPNVVDTFTNYNSNN